MARPPRRVERVDFATEGSELLVGHMAQLTTAGDGWINLLPKIGGGDQGSTSLGFYTMLSGGGSGLTMCTWIPRRADGRKWVEASLGIAQSTGLRAMGELISAGVAPPASWRVEQDHPRRGLVLRLPSEERNEAVLDWALRALGALCAPNAVARWHADIYLPTAVPRRMLFHSLRGRTHRRAGAP